MTTPKKVAHFIPAYRRHVDVDVAMALARDAAWCTRVGWTHMPFYLDGGGISRIRNIAVREAYEHGADLLLMQDADCFALPQHTHSALEALYRAMAKVSAAVVGAAIPLRRSGASAGMNCEPAKPGERYPGEVGTGLMLINLRTLEHLCPRPWFSQRDSEDGETMTCGEDIGFCRRVRELNLGVWVDYSIPTGHTFEGIAGSSPIAAVP